MVLGSTIMKRKIGRKEDIRIAAKEFLCVLDVASFNCEDEKGTP